MDETIRNAAHTGDVAAELAAKQRAGIEGGRLYLAGHVSFETALIQSGYPYGRRGKCLRAVWIESKPSNGFRFVYRTSAPYYPEDGQEAPAPNAARWNKPKASTYHEVAVLYLDHVGHVQYDVLGTHAPCGATDPEADISAFEARAKASITPDVERAVKSVRAVRRAFSRLTFTIKESTPVDLSNRAELDRLASEQEAEHARERAIVKALIRNEKAALDGRDLPHPDLGTADTK